MRKTVFLLLTAAILSVQALAIPAHRGFVPMPQPDGTMVSIGLMGDEFYHFNITEDGYTVMLNDRGAYEYAQLDGKTLKPSGVLAHNDADRSTQEIMLLANTAKYLTDKAEMDQGKLRRVKRDVDLSNANFDNFHGLVILIDFADVKFKAEDPNVFFTEMFSTEGFTGYDDPVKNRHVNCPGSVRDYFKDQSNGVFNPTFDVYGPYTSSRNASQCQNYSSSIFTTALANANQDIDFSQYDCDNDGKVDMIYFLVAGYSSSFAGNNSGYLWPHASSLSYSNITYDGKKLDRYACSTELYGFESTPLTVWVEGIGTICHEFSHVLGLPDMYDTDYSGSGGQSHDPGGWDMLASGYDYNFGRSPVGYSLFERYALGWATPKTITVPGYYTLKAANTSFEGYLLRTPVDKEFFTIENRQKTGWDQYLPGHGMIVMRVDSTDINVWTKNKVNCDPNHNYYEMLRAGNSAYGESASDPFPGTSGNVMITNETAPDLMTWAGLENDFNIMNIQEKNGIISFTVLENGSPLIGDVNDDGLIDIDDVTALIDMLLNGETSQSEVADVDGNGQINIHDVTALIDYILTGDMPQD
jgi:M6 family metalloprotease-like protein